MRPIWVVQRLGSIVSGIEGGWRFRTRTIALRIGAGKEGGSLFMKAGR
jgi:hypothetical protein